MFRLLKGVLVGALFCFVLLRVAFLFRLLGNGHSHASEVFGDKLHKRISVRSVRKFFLTPVRRQIYQDKPGK